MQVGIQYIIVYPIGFCIFFELMQIFIHTNKIPSFQRLWKKNAWKSNLLEIIEGGKTYQFLYPPASEFDRIQ